MVDEKSEPQFIYPSNLTLRKAYQVLVAKVLEERTVVFLPVTLIQAIIDGLGWVDDGNLTNPERPEGANYKKAKNILRTFEGKFTKFNRGGGLEVFVFRLDMKRVTTFQELEKLCSLDPYMSEIVATTEKLDLSQEWHDSSTAASTKTPVSDALALIDAEYVSRHAIVRDGAERAKKKRLVGKKKGHEIAKEVLDELKINDVVKECGGLE